MIPQEKIDEIISASDIVDIVSGYVQLKKRGKAYWGLCPFHNEKTPSFSVNPEKQLYYCFGCSKGGNVTTFIQEIEKLTFVEALHFLAERAGIQIPQGKTESDQKSETDILYDAVRLAGLFFNQNLTKNGEGSVALEYFHRRGLRDETIQRFGLGYSLNSWDAFIQKSKSENIPVEALIKSGLARKRDDGSVYDYFRGRAMFPIFNASARVVGFGARKIHDDDPIAGKYINSPETSIYNKSRILYGLSHAKEAIRSRDSALMVEGYLDLISLHQAGIENVVASSGTALTTEQVQLLRRYTKNLILVYDADSAGAAAALRGVDVAHELDLTVHVVELPHGEDPDSFVRKFGAKEFLNLVDQAISFIDFQSRQYLREGAFANPETKAQAVRSIVQSIAKMSDALKRSFYIKEVASKYELYESDLLRELEKWIPKEQRFHKGDQQSKRIPVIKNNISDISPQKNIGNIEMPVVERDLVKLLLTDNETLIKFIFLYVALEDFQHPQARHLAQLVLEHYEETESFNFASFVQSIDDQSLLSLISELSMRKYEPSRGWEELHKHLDEGDPKIRARDAIIRMKTIAIQLEIQNNLKRLNEASLKGEDKTEYLCRHQELLQLSQVIKSGKFFDVD